MSLTQIRKLIAWGLKPYHFVFVCLAMIPLVFLILYMNHYGSPFPFGDMYSFNAPVAFAAIRGTLNPSALMTPSNGHRIFFSRLLSAIVGVTTHWDLRYEMLANLLLGITNTLLLVYLFAQSRPQLTHIVLVPFALLVLSIQQGVVWLIGLYSAWHFGLFFLLLALINLICRPVRLSTFLVSVILAFCATISLGNGLLAWPLLLFILWIRGYGKRSNRIYLVVWIVMAVIGVAIFLVNNPLNTISARGPTDQAIALGAPSLGTFVGFVLTCLGAPIAFDNVNVAFYAGLVGCLFFILNVTYLWKQKGQLIGISIWIVLAGYALGSAVLVALTRYRFGLSNAMTDSYIQSSTCLWIAIVATLVMVIWTVAGKLPDRSLNSLLMYGNIVLLVVAAGCYIYTIYEGANNILYNNNATYLIEVGDCIARFPLSRDGDCSPYNDPVSADFLAAYRMAGYALQDPQLILPASHQASDKVIVNSDSAWLNLHIRDLLLLGIQDKDIINVVPATEQAIIANALSITPHPPANMLAGDSAENLARFVTLLDGTQQIWLVERAGAGDSWTSFAQVLKEKYQVADSVSGPNNLTITRYVLRSNNLNRLTF